MSDDARNYRFNRSGWGRYAVVRESDGAVLGEVIRKTETDWTAKFGTERRGGFATRRDAADFIWTNTGEKEPDPPAQPSALERVELLRAFIKAKSEGTEMRDAIHALDSLVSEVRAEAERSAHAKALEARCEVLDCSHPRCDGVYAAARLISRDWK